MAASPLVSAWCVAGLVGCAVAASPTSGSPASTASSASASADQSPSGVRVMVKLAKPTVDRAAVAAHAQDVAGVPVQATNAVSPDWHALSLACANAAACDAAIARLRADTGAFVAIETDARRRPLTP
ncbi:MAG: hypothetical protein JWP52_3939, partial [Rhizobacter sp.]|nr:hypothetical protein [Rhizobacter sp.]